MTELYAFEKYCGYTIVVEPTEDCIYEGIAYIHSYHNPEMVVRHKSGQKCIDMLVDLIDHKFDMKNHIW